MGSCFNDSRQLPCVKSTLQTPGFATALNRIAEVTQI